MDAGGALQRQRLQPENLLLLLKGALLLQGGGHPVPRSDALARQPDVEQAGDEKGQEQDDKSAPPGDRGNRRRLLPDLGDHARTVSNDHPPHVSSPPSRRRATRSFALRALGFSRASRSDGTIGLRVNRSSTGPSSPGPGAGRRNAVFTMRSSSEWKLMIATRPPGERCRGIASRNVPSEESSRFTAIRSAWNTLVAG